VLSWPPSARSRTMLQVAAEHQGLLLATVACTHVSGLLSGLLHV
jgi:hypothetical protein